MRRWLALSLAVSLGGIGVGGLGVARATEPPPDAVVDPALVEKLMSAAPTDEMVVFVRGTDVAAARRAVAASGLRLLSTWDRVGIAVAGGSPAAVERVIAQPGVAYVEPDVPVRFDLDTVHDATRANEAETAAANVLDAGGAPFDGSGISIAINDTGIDGTHEMFRRPDGSSKVVVNLRQACHQAVCDQYVPVADSDLANGHGTHVAGIAAGYERTTAANTTVRGAAPDASLVGLGSGAGLSLYGTLSGLNWVLENHADPCGDGSCSPIRVVNNSWTAGSGDHNPASATTLVVNALVAEGVVVVFSAGNGDTAGNGGTGTTNLVNRESQNPTPGVISVANYDDANLGTRDGALNSSSSRGRKGAPATYPDISAPGTLVLSSCTYALPICRSNGDVTDSNYARISGTSMSAPYIAGVVALLLEANPSLTPGQIEDAIEDTAYQFGDAATYEADLADRNGDHTTSFDKGHGLVDVVAALGDALGRTVPAGPACVGGGALTDPENDATDFVVETNAPEAVSDPDVDVVGASVTTDPATGALVFSVRFKDLRDTGPSASMGENLRYYFTYESAEYYIGAFRWPAGGTNLAEGYSLRWQPPVTEGATALLVGDLTGSFNNDTDTVTVVLPKDTINNWRDTVPVIETGDLLAGFEILSQRRIGLGGFVTTPPGVPNTVTPSADTAQGACPYVVGS